MEDSMKVEELQVGLDGLMWWKVAEMGDDKWRCIETPNVRA